LSQITQDLVNPNKELDFLICHHKIQNLRALSVLGGIEYLNRELMLFAIRYPGLLLLDLSCAPRFSKSQ